MKKKITMLFAMALVLVGGYMVVNASTKVFYSYANYSISSGKITETAVMNVSYDNVAAQLKVKSTTYGTQKTRFVAYAMSNHEVKLTMDVTGNLNPGSPYYVNIGHFSPYNQLKVRNYAYDKTGSAFAGWDGELYYLTSTGAM